jgi:hypothetical protein
MDLLNEFGHPTIAAFYVGLAATFAYLTIVVRIDLWKRIVGGAGAVSFFLGCAGHHFDWSAHLGTDADITSDTFHHTAFTIMQLVGAPMLLAILAPLMWRGIQSMQGAQGTASVAERRRFRTNQSVVGYLILFAFVLFGFIQLQGNLDHIQELREARITDQNETTEIVCERQNNAYAQIKDLNLTLAALVVGVIEPTGDDPEVTNGDRAALLTALEQLRESRKDLAPVKCADLPSQRPFEE